MSRLYLSQVDACKREVNEFQNQTPSVQKCAHGYVMAAQMEFRDADPRWAAVNAKAAGEKSVVDAALEQIMGSGDLKQGIQNRIQAVEEAEKG